MHPVLRTAHAKLIAELDGIDTNAAQIHPDGKPHRWTIQQVVEHLVLSLRTGREELEKRLEKKRLPQRTRRTRLEWAMQLMVLSLGYMPTGVPAEDNTSPASTLPQATGRELGQRLEAELELMDATLDRCRAKFGMERMGRNFLLGPLRVDQLRRYHVLHMRHHAGQLRQIRESLLGEVIPQPKAVPRRTMVKAHL